jgi:PIN domain
MCIIIDANQATNFFQTPPKSDFEPIWEWVTKKDGCIVFGGKLSEELTIIGSASRLLRVLYEAGKAIKIDNSLIDKEETIIKRLKICKSNDTHVIALARASGARIICTGDCNLEYDFKNIKLISKPKGKIYKNKTHKTLLKHSSTCKK